MTERPMGERPTVERPEHKKRPMAERPMREWPMGEWPMGEWPMGESPMCQKKKSHGRNVSYVVNIKATSEAARKGQICEDGNLYINQGDHIVIGSDEASKPSRIGYVVYMFEGEDGEKMAHVGFYERGTDTIMGDTSDPRELFLVHGCVDLYLSAISSKAKVVRRYVNRELWKNNGGNKRPFKNDDGVSYYFSKICDSDRSRFLDIVDDKTTECISCAWQKETDSRDAPKLTTDKRCFEWQGVIYSVGSAVFFESGDYRENEDPDKSENKENEYRFESINGEWLNTCKLDREAIFPERYRKPGKKCSTEFSEPYTIGIIEDIKDGRVVNITIRMFYRPEDLVDGKYGDPHLLYWTNRFYTIKGWSQWKDVAKGKCFVAKKTLLPNCDEWIKEGPYRFYFEKFYDHKKNIVLELPIEDKKPGGESKDTQNEEILVWPKLNRKLRSMDIYAGCGGLSNGLEKSGLVVTKWAIEKDKSASKSFRLNNPTATVIKGDCNKILSNLLLKLDTVGMPEKGEVDIIVGGPPCQGYSKMNRHNQKAPAKKNNSQVLNFLGFVDYYRPDYFIFENVENFVKFEDSLHLKLTIKCALRIGYQIAFGILDAGNYGLPQKRRRFFIVGAAPFLKLPNLPEPTHCFINKSRLNFKVDNKVYDTGETATGARGSLPYRNVTVRDAIADLPVLDDNAKSKDKKHQIPIEEDKAKRYEMEYDNRQPLSHYVRLLRQHVKRDDVVTCHQFTPLSSIMRKRIELIPENGNWMDLPNITVTLKNNVKTDILNYSFRLVGSS
ncbi:DNA (cytosine-5)-methyltransferase 1-like [Cylas formicarius]|uniref:DNA (cytosine-5)-methyltransferase 1-like n=1 Tax=Cylas formicarius TaxID=197179 RepID=UPI0029585C62|nr:DNA (cytosine-5)-methyltransferase 1-like [Cylas formicarius]